MNAVQHAAQPVPFRVANPLALELLDHDDEAN